MNGDDFLATKGRKDFKEILSVLFLSAGALAKADVISCG
jgi:hypothetical protein